MAKTKYVLNGGLAFSEEKDMKKLSKYAKDGWVLEGFSLLGLGYKLKKGASQELDYSLDYQLEADEEYFSYFKAAGWSHVCSADSAHVFGAPAGTTPIYLDRVSTIEKYTVEKQQMGKVTLISFIATVVLFLLYFMSNQGWVPEIVGQVSYGLALISTIILIFGGLPFIAYHFRVNKLKRKTF
ncbi:DUF2812 domain-containing protein [Bacillus spongiae]|uniref:DUF2812 domain-containing protein n=1 Tax=Bacillus spongiae TaxID=2683610 RepID=A0ABU8HBY1_9BACI